MVPEVVNFLTREQLDFNYVYKLFLKDIRAAYVECDQIQKQPPSLSREKKLARAMKPVNEAKSLLDECPFPFGLYFFLVDHLNPKLIHIKKSKYYQHFNFKYTRAYYTTLTKAILKLIKYVELSRKNSIDHSSEEMEERFKQLEIE